MSSAHLHSHSLQEEHREHSKFSWFLIGTAIGSVAAYFLDPIRGHGRRVVAKDKSLKFKREANEMIQRAMIHMKNKSEGLLARAQHKASHEPVNDQTLEARIRSEFGRIVTHSKSIKVSVHEGVATLSGPILTKEVDRVLACVRKVPGVKDIMNNLDAHATSSNIPELQGKGPEYLQ